MCRKLLYIVLYVSFFTATNAFACAVDDENSIKKSIYAEVIKEEDSSCYDITLNFPDSIPAGDSFVYTDPYVIFKISDISLELAIYNSLKEGYQSVSFFCLSEENISKTSIDIVYDSESTKNPKTVSFCRKSITIDNLGKFLAESDKTKVESEKQKQAE